MVKEWRLGQVNKSYSYGLPLIGYSVDEFCGVLFPQNQFVNCFIGAEERPEYDKHIFVLYRFSDTTQFKRFEEQLKKHENFVECYDPDPFHVMYVFEVPERFISALEKFKLGKYSEMSNEAKARILKFHKIEPNPDLKHPVYGVLYRMEYQYKYLEAKFDLDIDRTQEASSIPDYLKEIYLNQYKLRREDLEEKNSVG
jgi:hypothetical protein